MTCEGSCYLTTSRSSSTIAWCFRRGSVKSVAKRTGLFSTVICLNNSLTCLRFPRIFDGFQPACGRADFPNPASSLGSGPRVRVPSVENRGDCEDPINRASLLTNSAEMAWFGFSPWPCWPHPLGRTGQARGCLTFSTRRSAGRIGKT